LEKLDQFEELLRKAIWASLEEIFGENTARAVAYYVDPRIATSNTSLYSDTLRKIFQEGSKILEERCAEKLYVGLGLEFQKREGWTLVNYIEDAKQKFVKTQE
jgi:ribosomal protein L16 Arg81 hydroxylase